MKRLIPLASALALTMAAAGIASAQNGHGNGHGPGGPGRGNDGGPHGRQDPGPRRGHDDRGGPRADQGPGRGNGPDRGGPERRAEVRVQDVVRDVQRDVRRDLDRDVRREVERQVRAGNEVLVLTRPVDRGLLTGCPPGLAKRDNGCLPPGQARQIDRARADYDRYNYVWRTLGGTNDYRYQDGYVYRMNPQGGLLGYLPVLGGILSPGNVWPAQYTYQQPPQYYTSYYGLNDRYQYRYADGVLYGVDPQNQNIGQIAALLTGQQFSVGQRLPAGYDIYNVPYPYRSQYADSAQSLYRYNDGYVYQVDPTTQLVQAVIQLLT